ncbi:MAG: ABC transporter permease [Gemmatimonadaceae bacterium]|nr:ABC transporter permease [Gemmatimonadaceae bacterium]
MRDLRFAVRTLLRTPFVTAVALLSIALGIGANAAIFSLFDQMLLRPLPVHAPDELVNLSLPGPIQGSDSCNQSGGCDIIFSYPMFRDIEARQEVLSGVAGHRFFGVSLVVGNAPMTGEGSWVTGSYFSTLGLQPALGRLLTPADNEPGADNMVAVLSHGFWIDKLGGRPNVLGEALRVNGRTYTVVGVGPAGFDGTTLGSRALLFIPMQSRVWVGDHNGLTDRRDYWVYMFGRLKPGVSIAAARAGLDRVITPILTDVEAPLQEDWSAATMARFKGKRMVVEPGARGQSDIHGEARTPLTLLLGITGVVLLIACANIANLLLARGANRATEMGVRLALGAGRRQLVRQLLIESLLLSTVGAVLSLLVAFWTLRGIGALLPADSTGALRLDLQWPMVAFTGVLAVVTGLLFGLFPALNSTRADLISSIRAGAGQIAGGRVAARFRTGLVVMQIALSMALLASAGLFLKSLANVSRVELGMNVDDIVTFGVSPLRVGYDTLRAKALYARIEEELAAQPGVTAVTSGLVPLLANSSWGNNVIAQGFECLPDIDCNSRYNAVGAGYFGKMGVTLRSGRDFTLADGYGSPPVAVVNQAFIEKFRLGKDAVGKFIGRGSQGDSLNIQIVGVVPDVKYNDVKREAQPVFYLPWAQQGILGQLYFYLRTDFPPSQLVGALPAMMARIDPTLPVEDLRTMRQQVRENVFLDRMISILSASFALLATLLAAVGLYGVLAYSFAQRTREIGVRMALGADRGTVQRMVLRQVGLLTACGAVLGMLGAFGLGRAAGALLFGLESHDPAVFALSLVVLTAVSFSAGWAPALRASRTLPMHALRQD